ncbi:protein FAR1-RELATED SEQUENCE 5-like [Silene latifolia]|uniref:protein FAR1-RELATED SEQUENCE 5-like n=1 Tax=Silene latifolia TaxID=37657 RepID=UPI003D78843E
MNDDMNYHFGHISQDSPEIPHNSKERIPLCAPHLKPTVGTIFENLDEGMQFYKTYVANAGFKMRKSTQRMVGGVVMTKYCVCSKAGESKPRGKVKKRQRTRILCNAKIFLKRNDKGKYVIFDFHEGHTHLLTTPNTIVHLPESRELMLVHKTMIVENSKVNKGPVQSFRMFKEYVKGYRNVGASLEDFKNFWRDVKQFIKGYDAQMMIKNFMHKKAMCPSFYFDFDVDEKGRLSRVIWADPISIKNYSLFGDMTLFDTTFNMNTCKMIFAPFTAVDNHKKCVTFTGGLLRNESDDGFAWIFESFLTAMGGKYPKCIITDQDAGIKAGVKKVFKDKTHHRYCMWHIMKKQPDKIGSTLYRKTNFMKDLCACVWEEDIEPAEFEVEWNAACFTCGVKVLGGNTSDNIPIHDRERNKVYYVGFIPDGVKLRCSCKKFERHGLMCRHALYVLKEQGFEKVPNHFVLSRWSKLALYQPLCGNLPETLNEDCSALEVQKIKLGSLWSNYSLCDNSENEAGVYR